MTWLIIGAIGAAVLLMWIWVATGRTRAARASLTPKRELVLAPPPSDKDTPTSVWQILDRMLNSKEHTNNAVTLIASCSKAVARVVLSVGVILVLITAVTVSLALAIANATGSSTPVAIGSGVAIGGAAATWIGRAIWKRLP